MSLSSQVLYGSSRLGTMNYLSGQYGMSYHRVSYSQSVYTSTKLSTSDYYPFGSLMPGRTVMDTTVHCVDMTQIDRVWQPAYEDGLPFNSLFSEMSPWGAASYELSSDHGQLDLFIEDEQSGIELLLDSGIKSGSLVLEGKVSNITDRGIVLRVQGVDAEGNGVVYHQEHLGQFDGKMEIPLDSAYSDYVVNIQGLLQWSILGNTVVNGHWVETEVLVRVCDEVGDKYRFGFNGQEKVNEIAGMGNHNTAFYGEYSPSIVLRWNLDPKPNPSLSPYAMYQGNPIRYSDPLLDTIIAEKSAQADIKSDLKKVYKKDFFDFNSNDELNFNADGLKELNSLKSYSGKNKKKLATKESLLGMETMINSTEMTGINYSDDPIPIKAIDPGTSNPISNPKPSQLGGEFALTKQDLTGTTYSFSLMGRKLNNLVNVNPAPSTTQYVNVTLLQNPTSTQIQQSFQYKGRIPFTSQRHSLLMHGLGHVLYQGVTQQPDVIKFDNANRILSGDSHNDDPTGTHK